ncbi:DMT family transporter [uncultured Vibrio sp.]|uniref:DMT family transporter n=1 Tax=uncultured Vibrio sp. TaxID=114054 RepID=UPI0025E3BDBD|nr:DMT family transporter [uncultured Vibrio sp.]
MFSGYLAIFATVLLWSGFFLSLRGGAISALTPADMALTRFVIPAIVLLPITYRARYKILSIPKRYFLGMVVGGGLPYLLIAGLAMNYATVSDGSALVPGTLPLFVSAIAIMFYSQPLSAHRKLGLGLIVIGITLFLWTSFTDNHASNTLQGHLLFLLGSIMWAVFTISARVTQLPALVCAGVISLFSTFALVMLITFNGLDSALFPFNSDQTWIMTIKQWPFEELLGHLMIQGVGAGIIASFTFLHAISVLGAERTAAFGSLTPVVATLLAIVIFGENPTLTTWCGLTIICLGSVIASNVFLRNDTSLSYKPPAYTKPSR